MNDDLEAMDGLCAKIIEQRARIEALEAALKHIKTLEADVAASEHNFKTMRQLRNEAADRLLDAADRIEALEAALREIANDPDYGGHRAQVYKLIAQHAIAQEQDK